MPLFKKKPSSAGATTQNRQQVPDELCEQAQLKYGHQDFVGAFTMYATAIDKLHTMCVVAPAPNRIRSFSEADQPILDGLVNSAGAALAMNSELNITTEAEKAAEYLRQISVEAERVGADHRPYTNAMQELIRTARLA